MVEKMTLKALLQEQITPDDLLTLHSIPEAGRILGVGKNIAYSLVRSGALLSVAVGGKRMVSAYALKLYAIEQQLASLEKRTKHLDDTMEALTLQNGELNYAK